MFESIYLYLLMFVVSTEHIFAVSTEHMLDGSTRLKGADQPVPLAATAVLRHLNHCY